MGSTSGPRRVRLAVSARPATAMTLRRRNTPRVPSESSPLPMHPNASSSQPRCVRTLCTSSYFARALSRSLQSIAAAPSQAAPMTYDRVCACANPAASRTCVSATRWLDIMATITLSDMHVLYQYRNASVPLPMACIQRQA